MVKTVSRLYCARHDELKNLNATALSWHLIHRQIKRRRRRPFEHDVPFLLFLFRRSWNAQIEAWNKNRRFEKARTKYETVYFRRRKLVNPPPE